MKLDRIVLLERMTGVFFFRTRNIRIRKNLRRLAPMLVIDRGKNRFLSRQIK